MATLIPYCNILLKLIGLKKSLQNKPLLFRTTVSMYKVISITYVSEVLPWQQAKYSSVAPDKGTQDECDTLRVGNSLVLPLD